MRCYFWRRPRLCSVNLSLLVKAFLKWRSSRIRRVYKVDVARVMALNGQQTEESGGCYSAYSALAFFRMGMSGSASFQSARKS